MISLSHYLVLGAILFSISVIGIFLNRKNLIVLLMAIELMLLAVPPLLYAGCVAVWAHDFWIICLYLFNK